MARRADRSAAEAWRERLERQKRSGISIAAFCRREGVSQPSFYQWRRRLAATPSARDGAADRPWFVPVQVADELSASGGVEIDLPGGAVVRLPAGAAPELVIAAIEAAARAAREDAC